MAHNRDLSDLRVVEDFCTKFAIAGSDAKRKAENGACAVEAYGFLVMEYFIVMDRNIVTSGEPVGHVPYIQIIHLLGLFIPSSYINNIQ